MGISKSKVRKHSIDIMFLMILFLIFTFSAVSVLLMAVNSYKSVVYANEENSNCRTAIAYVREKVRQHDTAGAIELSSIDGVEAIKMSEGEGYSLYIYWYEGSLMELEAKDGSGVTVDFGNNIMEVQEMSFSCDDNQLIKATVVDENGNKQEVSIGVKSKINKK